ncbi:MAG: hypothetical protein EPO08_01945 [Rhodospirillaceae bacterium]|nr:MAG: hypothetical protein EPO08_01945 [Rhodospirillaceae bacterium]
MESQRLVILSGGLPGRENDYVAWYRDQHLGDIVAIDGVLAGQLCTADPPVAAGGRHVAAVYDIAPDAAGPIFAEIARRRGTPAFPQTDAFNPPVTVFSVARARGPWKPASSVEAQSTHRLIALGVEAETMDLLGDTPGGWRAYSVESVPGRPPSPWSSLSYAAVSPSDPAAFLAQACTRCGASGFAREEDFLGLFRQIAQKSRS